MIPPWQIAAKPEPALTVGFGFTVNVLVAVADPHKPPDVVRVKITEAGELPEVVYVAVAGVLPPLLANVPPSPPSLHTADVAPPPNEPPKAGVVPPWQRALNAEPAPAVGL